MMEKIENTEGIERRGNVLAAMAKLKQVCNHPAQLLHDRSPVGRRSGKVIRLEEILEEILAEGDRVLCFTQFTEFAELLVPHLAAALRHATSPTCTAAPRRSGATRWWRGSSPGDGPPIFLLSLKAGGTGLEPHRGQPRRAPRPVVEPGGGEPGHRPGVPDRAAAHRAGAQVHLHGHARGEDRRR